ncbi:hypothetical protein ACQBAU_16315 [Propionibacteriaceae bacterium Y2011]
MLYTVDVEAWTARKIAAFLTARPDAPDGIIVSNEWYDPGQAPVWYVVVRYDPGARDRFREDAAGLGITIIGDPDDIAGLETNRVANLIAAYLQLLPAVEQGNPYADLTDVSGPARIDDESGRPVRYLTANAVLVGTPTQL